MTKRHKPLTRSETMSRIKGRDTGPELEIRRRLHARGLRYRVNHRIEGCRPDIVFTARRVAVFIDGCFWHGCPAHAVRPSTNTAFWDKKIATNMERDQLQSERLRGAGWRVLRFWEHSVEAEPDAVVQQIVESIMAGRRRNGK